jgi:hypothetical protein
MEQDHTVAGLNTGPFSRGNGECKTVRRTGPLGLSMINTQANGTSAAVAGPEAVHGLASLDVDRGLGRMMGARAIRVLRRMKRTVGN